MGRGFAPVIEFEKLTGLHIPCVDARRGKAYVGDLFAQPDGDKRPRCVRGNIYGCTDLSQGGGCFKDFGLNSNAGQRIRSRQSSETAPNNRHAYHNVHHSIEQRAQEPAEQSPRDNPQGSTILNSVSRLSIS